MRNRCDGETRRFPLNRCAAATALALAVSAPASWAQDTATLDSIQVTGSWLGTGLQNSVKNFAGARTVVDREEIADTGATSIGDVLRRIPGVQSSDNSGTAGSAISLNVGVRGLTGRYSPRSTILLDGVPLAVAPYGQPQISFAAVSLANIESVDVVRGGGAVRYGPQNVGGIINFTTRAIPTKPGLTGDATVRLNHYGEGGNLAQYSTFLGTQLDSGLGLALLYSGISGRGWREGSDERVNDLALKWRYELTPSSEVYGKFSYYDVRSDTPGGLTVAQFKANPFQNTRPSDYWTGERKSFDVGYVNTLSDDQEFEIRAYYNDSTRASALINAAGTQLAMQPRDYEVLGIEPRYTHRLRLASTTHDVTVGYRYLRERGNDRVYNVAVATGLAGATTRNNNATDAHALYIDDRIALGAWRITPGLRFEHIESERDTPATGQAFDITNNKGLPSLNVAYLLTPAVTLFANYSTSYGPVQNLQLNSQSASNPLKPEVAKTMEAGARWTQGASSAELTVFKMKFDNQILQVAGVTPTLFRNIGATDHDGIESAVDYAFDKGSALAGLAVYANFTYTRAVQKSGADAGRDVPFYSRITDTLGARYTLGAWRFNLATTHQSKQYSDTANTEAESANAGVGRIPGFRLWNLQADWKVPGAKGTEIALGINNLFDKRYYTRNVDGNAGRMAGAPRMFFVQGRYAF
ncbi:TonB-dependent receptor family protein [Pseudorhodoferax sp.]|uniref:TonB-dependent receptor family protein n=1 Tax=Pseudorhodoferax sp. TaxID=1993553 RepID=UPI002DD62510|nr:TonB-dependent siderophore receptor [Pseudorhodoferax sp.]